MADVLTKYNGCPANTNEITVATIAANTAFIIKEVILSNLNAAAKTALLKFDDTVVVPTTSIVAADGIRMSGMDTVLTAGDTIKITSGSANEISYYISGMTVDN